MQTAMMSTFVSPSIVERAMEWEEGRLAGVAWLLIQEMSQGNTLERLSQGLNVGVEDLVALIEFVTGKEGDEASAVWQQAIIALRAAVASNQNQLQHGWDSIEAMAVEKLGKSLVEMKTNGDPLKMLAIATAANKAIRRHEGEGKSPSVKIGLNQPADGQGADMTVELKSGALGSMRLSLSPRIQAQLGDPNRIIEAVANKKESGKLPLTMIGLKETRRLADPPTPEPEAVRPDGPHFDIAGIFGEPTLDD